MTHLLAIPTHDIPITTTSTAGPASSLVHRIALGALPSNMARYIAQVAYRIVVAVTSKVTSLPTILARLVIGAVSCYVTLLVAVIAQPQVTRCLWWGAAVSSTVARLSTGVADALIWAVSSHVTRFSAVPA